MAARNGSVKKTAEQILDVAEARAKRVGFNGFSYADIATELGVTTASIHYHFPTKANLGANLIERYTRLTFAALDAIQAGPDETVEKLRRYAGLYEEILAADALCLCAMLASEYETLPEPMQQSLQAFFRREEEWVNRMLCAGRDKGEFAIRGEPETAAATIVSTLQGAMLVARAYGGTAAFRASSHLLLGWACAQKPTACV